LTARPSIALAALALMLAAACGAPEHADVLVIVNEESPVSVAIGRYYAAQRGIPDDQIVALSIPLADPSLRSAEHETISRANFETQIRGPLERLLRETGLDDDVRILVTTKGVPLKVSGPAIKPNTLLRDATAASVDAELSLLFSSWIGSPGVAKSTNPYYDETRAFAQFRRDQPDSPLRYMVARLTGYQSEIDAETGVPRDIRRMIDMAAAPETARGLWLIDQDPSLSPGMDAGHLVLMRPAAAILSALGRRTHLDEQAEFVADQSAIQAYTSWGSNDGHEPGPRTYGKIDGHSYPGEFAPRSLAIDFVSTNARTFTAPPRYGQSLIADLLALGAAAAPGHVNEPTLPAVVRPHILLRRYAEGIPAIEAYYRALPYLGWMNVYVGDPLMRIAVPETQRRPQDLDGDTILDARDNCSQIPNTNQRDTDGDGFGNLCDADVDGDGRVTTSWGETFPRGERGDVEWIALTAKNGPYDPDHDLDGDGVVDERDVSIAQIQLFQAPGPGALSSDR
jgi:uncharacterized protein (TIGR03790 family)